MVHVNPDDVVHLRYASQRGYGPMALDRIEVAGDYPLEEVKQRTKNFRFCVERIDDYFSSNPNLSCSVGTFPEKHSVAYCHGGCPGALQEAVHIFRGFDPDVDKKMKKVRYVVGHVNGTLNLADEERVLFVGNCTSWEGEIDGQPVSIKSSYKTVDPLNSKQTASNDLLLKTTTAIVHSLFKKPSRFLHVRGCPVSVAQHVNYLSALANIKNPNFNPSLIGPISLAYWQMRFFRFLNRLFG
jgi:hypothetical protein